LPCIAKTTFGGYDGKGQFLLKTTVDVEKLATKLKTEPAELILEEKVVLDAEVSCIVGRAADGVEVVFPVFENQHRDHILDVTLLPARVPFAVQEKLKEIAVRASSELEVHGLLTIEFFLTRTPPKSKASVVVEGWHILINEFAPRPHNSGHITMKACDLSQFDILARVLLGVPLRQPTMVGAEAYCMGNLLGDLWLEQANTAKSSKSSKSLTSSTNNLDLSALATFPDVIDVVLYGKSEARAKRKMGHFIISGQEASVLPGRADQFRTQLV
jgi:5-(carboxyamino)imidazole ribonucleotide synthase